MTEPDYTVTKLHPAGSTYIYETKLADGTSNRFAYSGTEDDPMYDHWVKISVKRAMRSRDYLRDKFA